MSDRKKVQAVVAKTATPPPEPEPLDHSPKKMTAAENVILTLKIGLIVGAVLALIWFVDQRGIG